jgi:acyl homoserine lactone synthase
MQLIDGTSQSLQTSVVAETIQCRHKALVEKRGQRLHYRSGPKDNQFDHRNTVYFVGQNNEAGDIASTTRLLVTIRPYLLHEVLPHLITDQPLPCAEDIYRLSRFAAMEFSAAGSGVRQQLWSRQAADLLKAAHAQARRLGVTRLISHLGLDRRGHCG